MSNLPPEGRTSNVSTEHRRVRRPRIASFIRSFSPLIIIGWLAVMVLLSVTIPPLEVVERQRSVSLSPADAPSVIAAERIGQAFEESTGGSVAIIVLEGTEPLGEEAHRYYDEIIRQLKDDPQHVQHVQDFWGDPLTAGAAESADRKAAYVQMDLVGELGQAEATNSVTAVRDVVDRTPAPPGVKTYVTGPSASSPTSVRAVTRRFC